MALNLPTTEHSSIVDLQVRLAIFEGPFGLLLHLIETRELAITDISLAQVTDQYLAYLAAVEELNPGALADFLIIASELIFIKSKALLPSAAPEDEEDEDDEMDLAQRLREYKRMKETAQYLQKRVERGLQSFGRAAPPPHFERDLTPGVVSIGDLARALQKLLKSRSVKTVPGLVAPYTVTIEDQMTFIKTRLQDHKRTTFTQLFDHIPHKLEIIVTFLALLELIRIDEITAQQETPFAEIVLRREDVKRDA